MPPLNTQYRKLIVSSTCVLAMLLSTVTVAQDAVYKIRPGGKTSKVAGKITATSPEGVTINGTEVPSAEIKKVTYANEPPIVDRARKQMEAGRYSDAIEELKKIKGTINKRIRAEVDFINAYSTAQISLRGGSVTPKVAAGQVKTFITNYPDSHNLIPAADQFARLAFAAGLPGVAAKEFQKLSSSNWVEYQLKGNFHAGQMQLILNQLDQAKASFAAIQGMGGTDDMTQSYKMLATCELAKIDGLQGNDAKAQKTIEQLIKQENSDNKKLFAHLYNSLGAVHEKAGRFKEARDAYLHTELLYASEAEAHAEAVYRLAKIWADLEKTDRANRARDLINSRYRNSYWAGKL